MTPFGVFLAYIFARFGLTGVMVIIFPIVLVRYTFYLYIESKTQYIQTVDTLMHAMEARDKYTEGHSKRVAEITTLIAKDLKYSDIKIERLHIASLLHDVGKIGIDDKILNKPGKLTAEEYEAIKTHPQIGYDILKDIKNLHDILPIIRNHHERYDGKGYPDGKKLEELDLDVFIVQLADTIDAMTTDRPYRKALSEEEVISEITKYSGTQFHPKVVQAYLNILEKQKKAV
jgi:HD-GYP domain-containing protein (c-di-GMP phosphodiesterase class II)